jgi:hypothetical protein
MEIPNPSMSDARCAESAKIAIDPDKYPPISCAVMKKTETKVTWYNFLIAF